jgi:hypothetical protein
MPGRSTYRGEVDSKDARIRELREELYSARRALFHRLGESFQQIIDEMPRDVTYGETYDWFEEAMGQVLHLAESLSADERTDEDQSIDRARCPLCGGSASDYYNPNNGFAYPEGLRRHLLGENNTNQCEVSKQVLAHARYLNEPPILGAWRPNKGG